MKRLGCKFALLAGVTLAVFFAAGVAPAYASLPPAEVSAAHTVLEDPANATTLSNFLRGVEPYTLEQYEAWVAEENATGELVTTGGVWPVTTDEAAAAADVTSDLWAARVAAGVLPEVGVALGTVTLGAGALYLGWKIGRWIDTKFLGLGSTLAGVNTPTQWGPDSFSTYEGDKAVQWNWITAGTTITSGVTAPSSGYYLEGYHCITTGSACSPGPGTGSLLVFQACQAGSGGSCISTRVQNQQEAKISSQVPLGSWVTLTGTTAQALYASAATFRSAFSPETNLEPYGSQQVTNTCSACVSDPGTITGTPLSNAISDLENHDNTAVSIAHQIAPNTVPDDPTGVSTTTGITVTTTGGSSPFPIYVPSVLPGETVQEYQDRLAARQWLGAISVTSDTTAYPANTPAAELAPGAITSVTANGVTVSLYDPATGQPLPWPIAGTSTVPQIDTSTDTVTVTDIPSGSGGTGVPGLDFTPFTGMSSTCNFPFGVLCWVHDTVNAMNTSPVAPELNWTLPNIDMGPLGTMTMGQHYDVNLGATSMDTYMGWIRTIESWVLWLGTIWYVGSRLLGLKGGGDPTDAVDESFGAFTE